VVAVREEVEIDLLEGAAGGNLRDRSKVDLGGDGLAGEGVTLIALLEEGEVDRGPLSRREEHAGEQLHGVAALEMDLHPQVPTLEADHGRSSLRS
jgi:hypothetical protein